MKILFHFGLFKGKHINFSAFDTEIVEYFPLNSIWLGDDFHIIKELNLLLEMCVLVCGIAMRMWYHILIHMLHIHTYAQTETASISETNYEPQD